MNLHGLNSIGPQCPMCNGQVSIDYINSICGSGPCPHCQRPIVALQVKPFYDIAEIAILIVLFVGIAASIWSAIYIPVQSPPQAITLVIAQLGITDISWTIAGRFGVFFVLGTTTIGITTAIGYWKNRQLVKCFRKGDLEVEKIASQQTND